jgi:DNA-binding transcriptional MerR regulator
MTAIRFYAEKGLVKPAKRTPAGFRRYDEKAVQRFRELARQRDQRRKLLERYRLS